MNQKFLIFLVILLIAISFLAGIFFTRWQSLEKSRTEKITPPSLLAGQPSPALLSEEQVSKLTQTGQVLREKQAKVVMVEFADFQCPYCARYTLETFPKIYQEYIKTGKIQYIFHHFPLLFHQYAQKAAEAAECAGEQGKFWEMHDKILGNQQSITLTDLQKYAAGLGLKTTDFKTCLSSDKFKNKVQADFELGQSVGITGTPTFFINGQLVSGAQPFENFRKIIEEELGK